MSNPNISIAETKTDPKRLRDWTKGLQLVYTPWLHTAAPAGFDVISPYWTFQSVVESQNAAGSQRSFNSAPSTTRQATGRARPEPRAPTMGQCIAPTAHCSSGLSSISLIWQQGAPDQVTLDPYSLWSSIVNSNIQLEKDHKTGPNFTLGVVRECFLALEHFPLSSLKTEKDNF